MPKTYTQDALWKLFENLPLDLKEAIFSEDTAKHIWEICERHEIDEVPKIAEQIGLMLMGLLALKNFEDWLMKELNIKKDVATIITQEVNKFIILPVRPALENINKDAAEINQLKQIPKQQIPEPTVQKRTPTPPSSKDLYKESTEEAEE